MRWDGMAAVVGALWVVGGCADGGATTNGGGLSVAPPAAITGAGTGGIGSAGVGPQGGAGGSTSVMVPPASGTGAQQPMPMGTAGTMAGTGAQQPMPMGGAPAAGTGGGTGESGTGGTTNPTPTTPGAVEPIVPMVTESCPEFRAGTISFMGLGGIRMDAGSKASGPTAPMIFYWHGTGSTSGEYSGMAGAVHRGAMQEGGVLISFQGSTGGDLLSGTAIFGAGDFNIADQLFACAVQNHNVDPRRVFSTGCSAGGLFAGAMGAMRSNYIAAVAPNSGGWTTPTVRWERQDWTPALMTVHGAPGTDVVIIDFSDSSRTADMAYKQRGGFVINCNHGGIHCGGGGLAGDIWEFFKAHPYGTKPSPWAGALPSGFSSQCMIF